MPVPVGEEEGRVGPAEPDPDWVETEGLGDTGVEEVVRLDGGRGGGGGEEGGDVGTDAGEVVWGGEEVV